MALNETDAAALLRHTAGARSSGASLHLYQHDTTVRLLHHPSPPPTLFTLACLANHLTIPDTHQSNHTPLITFIPHFSEIKKKSYSGNNGPKCSSLPLPGPLSFSLSILFYSLVHTQRRTMRRRRAGWRLVTGLVTR